MKIALCISGMPRSFKLAYPYIKKTIIDPLNPDIFINTWKVFVEKSQMAEFCDLYKAFKFEFEDWDQDTLEDKFNYSYYKKYEFGHFQISKGMLPMYYKIFKANEMARKHSEENNFKYDLVIRCRADLSFGNEINGKDIYNAIYDKSNPLYLRLDKNEHHPEIDWWVCDHFAFGRPEVMNIYADTFNEFEENILHAEHVVPELLLKAQLERHNINYKPTNIVYDMIR